MPTRLTHDIGDRIADRWQVADVLGRGAYGTVYLCATGEDGPSVVVKEMHVCADAAAAATALAFFRREAEVQSGLEHPNILPAEALDVPGPFRIDARSGRLADENTAPEDVIDVPARYYLAFQCDVAEQGRTLEELVANGQPLPTEHVLNWTKQIAGALTYLQGQGLIHRDAKPANILLSDDGNRAYLIDFGLACPVRHFPGYGTVPIRESGRFGTPGYAPPDPVEQEEPTELSDLHALGMTARRALTGLDPVKPDDLETLRTHAL